MSKEETMNEKTDPAATKAQYPFFEATDRPDGSLEINFLTKSTGPEAAGGKKKDNRINILPGRYEEFRAMSDRFAGRTVVATGRGPIEGYFAIGYYASLAGAAKLIYDDPVHKTRNEMPDATANPADKPWLRVERQSGAAIVSIAPSPKSNGKWDDAEIGFSTPALLPPASLPVTFTGNGAVRMYLLLGVSAARAGLVDVRVIKPANPYAIRFTPERAGETVAIASGKTGVVVGVIGDPNSGKSVFSRAFSMALRHSTPDWFQSWIYDCDLASPTPDWYCTAMIDFKYDEAAEKEYKDLRNAQKVKWNPDMERRCANDLAILRTNLDLVIADLPGGKHKDDAGAPLASPVRIGRESRANMFRQCDAFVLICRKDRHDAILKGWLDALAEFGLQDRVMAVLDSSAPDDDFSISPLEPDADGILHGDIRGLNREHPAGETGLSLAAPVRPLVRALAAIPVVNAARAATATAFLTGDKGTRYGAAVRSASTGRIFAVGQYSSFNHSTNIHAEMNALAMAATAGEPDVDILAVASTSAEEASPCGVCRQVIVEHAARTGRDFDVALTTPGARPVFMSASELLPRAWHAHCNGAPAPAFGGKKDVRTFPGVDSVFNEPPPPLIGSEFIAPPACPGAFDRMALVWDDAFCNDTALVKFKYERTPDCRWLKLPHAFTDSAAYLRYLTDSRSGSAAFPGLAMLKLSDCKERPGSPGIPFKHPVPLSCGMLDFFGGTLFSPAGIDAATAVFVTCSRMTGLATASSDWDLCVAATPKQIDDLRACVVALASEGRVTFPDKSRSWKLLKDSFPGAAADGGARIHAERRYAESFRLDDIPVSFLFVHPGSAGREFAFPGPFTAEGRSALTGRVVDASRAPYKRSESVIVTSDHRRVRLLCYYKTANLLKDGDNIAATGVRCLHPGCGVLGCEETLVLSAPAVDKLVWLP